MQRGHLDHLVAFVAVGRERNFTKAAAKLGVSQSALSHTIKELEERVGVRLLTRTTRNVSATAAGERLLQHIAPRFEEIFAELRAVAEFREKPAGTIRISATEFAIDTILVPKLSKLLKRYPDIKVETIIDYGLTDIVTQRYEQSVRSGEQVAKGHDRGPYWPRSADGGRGCSVIFQGPDGAAKTTGPVGSRLHQAPPAEWRVLCLGIREGRTRAEGPCRRAAHLQHDRADAECALAGLGLAYVPEGMAQHYLGRHRLKQVLRDWCLPFSGYHLWYRSRRQSSAAFALVVEALRYRAGD